MGPVILGVGMAAWAVREFGDERFVRGFKNHLLIGGYVLMGFGALLTFS